MYQLNQAVNQSIQVYFRHKSCHVRHVISILLCLRI